FPPSCASNRASPTLLIGGARARLTAAAAAHATAAAAHHPAATHPGTARNAAAHAAHAAAHHAAHAAAHHPAHPAPAGAGFRGRGAGLLLGPDVEGQVGGRLHLPFTHHPQRQAVDRGREVVVVPAARPTEHLVVGADGGHIPQ